jgi:hypothetical protein
MPCIGPSAAAFTAALTSSTEVSFAERKVRSTTEPVGHGGADREAVELARELRQHERDGLRGARRGRDEVDRRRARAAQVGVRRVEQALVARVGVDRRHEAVLDADRVVDRLGERREAVRRAGGERDDLVGALVVLVVVDARGRS